MRTGYVVVKLEDLAALADHICEMDGSVIDNETAGACHSLIMQMMGEHAKDFYAPDDGSEG